jgi:hypothetical protein
VNLAMSISTLRTREPVVGVASSTRRRRCTRLDLTLRYPV